MKKILALFLSIGIIGTASSQTFQATIQPVGATSAVNILVKTPSTVTGKVTSTTLTIAIPTSVGARPPLSIDNTADPFITYDVYNAVNQDIQGVTHYIYNLIGTGDVTQAGATLTFNGGADVPLAKVIFNGNPSISSQIKLVNLPDGGVDPNPNSYFGLNIGGDVVNEASMFYSIPNVSTSQNDGQGYAGTSFAQTIPQVPLPIRFLGFTAVKKDNDAKLDWNVENESAMTGYYEIQRSFTGVDFTAIGTVNAFNNGNTSNAYNSFDRNLSALRSSGKIYYRIKQVDKDGRYIYSEIRSVRLDGKTFDVSVYPNPVEAASNIYVDLADARKVNIKLIDATGKTIQVTTMNGIKGLNVYPLNMNKLASGTYIIQVEADTESKAIPVIKNK